MVLWEAIRAARTSIFPSIIKDGKVLNAQREHQSVKTERRECVRGWCGRRGVQRGSVGGAVGCVVVEGRGRGGEGEERARRSAVAARPVECVDHHDRHVRPGAPTATHSLSHKTLHPSCACSPLLAAPL